MAAATENEGSGGYLGWNPQSGGPLGHGGPEDGSDYSDRCVGQMNNLVHGMRVMALTTVASRQARRSPWGPRYNGRALLARPQVSPQARECQAVVRRRRRRRFRAPRAPGVPSASAVRHEVPAQYRPPRGQTDRTRRAPALAPAPAPASVPPQRPALSESRQSSLLRAVCRLRQGATVTALTVMQTLGLWVSGHLTPLA